MTDTKLVLVDTSYWIDILRKNGNKDKKQIFEKFLLADKVAWTEPIKLELWNGSKSLRELEILEQFNRTIKTLNVSNEVWELSLKIGSYLRRKGLTVPCVDILIISVASNYEVQLLHSDKHFDLILQILPKAY